MNDDGGAKSLLFLSCDIVGSTRYKQQTRYWQKTFLSFYREFPQLLGDLTKEKSYQPGFNLWKPVGDELIFTSHVKKEADIYSAVRIWLCAMERYESTVLEDVSTLSTKGGAFVGTFPGPDNESSIPRDPASETSDKDVIELNAIALDSRSPAYLYDFFGPSIDTGFRVFSACSNRFFTLSVEVAWAMAQCATEAGVGNQGFDLGDIRLLEPHELKGVWDGREYPLFALDRHHNDSVNRAMARIRETPVEALDVVNLCKECYNARNWPSRLYLPDSIYPQVKAVPQNSLSELLTNGMEGAESVPMDAGEGEPLGEDVPLGETSTAERQVDTNDS
jgi:hypothetical protein